MERISIEFADSRYPFFLGTDCAGPLVEQLLGLEADAYFVIADERVAGLYGAEWLSLIRRRAPAHLVVHASAEAAKRLATVEAVLERILELNATRASCVVALGGGVTGNLAGLSAALAFRGIRLVHVPTTLLAMLDSVLSLKQAVNASRGKNLIGTFYCPQMVLADTAFLRSLPASEIRSGMCEVVKNALAIHPAQIEFLRSLPESVESYGDAEFVELVRGSVQAKTAVMRDDDTERYTGLVLEYGHTIGHAVEHASEGAVPHGEAVGLGMLGACEIAVQRGRLAAEAAELHRELLGRIGAPMVIPPRVTHADVIQRVRTDNKRGYLQIGDGSVAMVLLDSPGQPCWTGSRPLVPVGLGEVEAAVATLQA